MKQFTSRDAHVTTLGGVTKKVIVKDYLLKFGREKFGLLRKDYISEFIACKIAKQLGYSVQEVHLAYLDDKPCVAIELFQSPIITTDGFGESTLSDNSLIYDLDGLLSFIPNKKFAISQQEYYDWVWATFLLDMFIGNFDRHIKNWGFIRNNDGLYIPAPYYDMGSSLRINDWTNNKLTNNKEVIRKRLTKENKTVIKFKGKSKVNYVDILKEVDAHRFVLDIINRMDYLDLDSIFKEVYEFDCTTKEYLIYIKNCLIIGRELMICNGL